MDDHRKKRMKSAEPIVNDGNAGWMLIGNVFVITLLIGFLLTAWMLLQRHMRCTNPSSVCYVIVLEQKPSKTSNPPILREYTQHDSVTLLTATSDIFGIS